MASKRKPLSHRERFDVLSAGGFRCHYCGQSAPDVILHVEHVVPIASGGTDDPTNLVPACSACNAGKGARGVRMPGSCRGVHSGHPEGPLEYALGLVAWVCSSCRYILCTEAGR